MDHMETQHAQLPRKILLGVFGLSDYELRLLRSVLSLTTTSGRKHAFALQDPECGRCPDIAIVDPDNANANAALQRLIAQNQASAPPMLRIWQSAPSSPCPNSLVRPLAPTKMLALLDQIATALMPQSVTNAAANTVANAQLSNVASKPSAPIASTVAKPQIVSTVSSTAALAANSVMPLSAHLSQSEQNLTPKPRFRALVVDDSPTVRAKIEVELRAYGVVTDAVMSGEQGLQMLTKNEYDIVFLDIVLPGADGYEICRAIKHNRDTKRLPVVMLTSKSSPFDRIRGSLAGCSTYLTKPVDHATFHAVVERYLVAAQDQHAAQSIPAFA